MSKPSPPPHRRLGDGTPYFGSLGELARDEEDDLVQCHLCGEWFRAIGGAHLRHRHGWTLDEYRDAFKLPRGAPTWARSLSRRQSARATGQVKAGSIGLTPGERLVHGAPAIRPWRTLATQNPALAAELDPDANKGIAAELIAAGSHQKLWWRCRSCIHLWKATVNSRNAGHGCPACARREAAKPIKPSPGRSLTDLHPDIVVEWDIERNLPLKPDAVRRGSHRKVWWCCRECGHRWQTTLYNRSTGHGCPKCGIARRAKARSRVPFERSLLARFPQIAAQLRPKQDADVDASSLGAASAKKLWWRCPECRHEWQALVSNRTAGNTGCPACARR